MISTRRRRNFYKLISIFLALFILTVAIFWQYEHNIHTIIPHEFYRSGQLDTATLTQLVTVKHIRSIINLRGPNLEKKWYIDEIKTSRQLGVAHYDIALSGIHLTRPEQLRALIQLLETAPKPVLIHCQGGADRSGLTAAIILILHGASLEIAKKQISWKYFAISPHSVGRLVIPYYEAWLRQHGLQSNRQNFLLWAKGLVSYQPNQPN